MSTQSEQLLEDNLIKQLTTDLGYTYIAISDEAALLANLKTQLEKHNNVRLTDREFGQVLNHLNKGNIFERAKILRDKMQLTRENGQSVYIEFLNMDFWCQNQYQVTHQIKNEGSYKNRYDVTLLINGLPLVQIELKKRGLELKEAFNQINRYQRHSFGASNGLFLYVQIFVISNGVNTKYYANNPKQSFKQTFYWSDTHNKPIRQLEAFSAAFLEACHLSKMITRYTVQHETWQILMVMRSYQYYATEAIIERVKNTNKNGYIWHTTGSGKTLTSFKTSQILATLPQVHKVVFVVDRKDLDYQTQKEFDSFSKGSVDATEYTGDLVKKFTDDTKIIVTTIQKLSNAISKQHHLKHMDALKDKRIVFIFDECHRSQFGKTHDDIKKYFGNAQLFGFTGTPIFVDNSIKNERGKRTTKDLFDECLHKYVITDAIRDENVLRFTVEYVGKYRRKDDTRTEIDIEVEAIDTKELMESPQRLEKIVDYIIANHEKKTHNKEFSAMFCTNSVETLIKYYDLFKAKKEEGKHHLRVVTVFSYTANEDDKNANGMLPEEDFGVENEPLRMAAEPKMAYRNEKLITETKHTREKLDEFIGDYNRMYNTKYSTKDNQDFYNYYKDIAKRIKEREKEGSKESDRVDILLVVNMFLTGFDAKKLNTLYVDKNLKYHGLIQAYSRTNRILNEKKSQGNIVCFRNLKNATDDAITLFSNKEAKEEIIMKPYEDYVTKFNKAYEKLLQITPTVDSVDELPSEDEELEFVKAFRELMRIKNIMSTFSDFHFEDLQMDEQDFEDFKSKYLDLHDKVKSSTQKEAVSILNDVDFELELIQRDEINVAYILRLLARLKEVSAAEQAKQRKEIMDMLSGEVQLRSKRELIEKFINENLPIIEDADDVKGEFEAYWEAERQKGFEAIWKEEKLNPAGLQSILSDYLFSDRKPLRDDVIKILEVKPKLLERKTIGERIIEKIVGYVDTFFNGMEG